MLMCFRSENPSWYPSKVWHRLMLVITCFTLPASPLWAVDFVDDVLPILQENCHECHGAKKQESSLRLDNRETALKGGYHGTTIEAGDPAASLLLEVITGQHADLPRMPKGRDPLTEAQISIISTWIERGAAWPDSASVEIEAMGDHWAFDPPVRPEVPAGSLTDQIRNPIDAFVFARLEREGMQPSPEAGKATLVRRLHLNLIGLPPTVDELDSFLSDNSPDAFNRLVESLLSSPHHGERWARLWLDAARYADSDGFEKDKPRDVWLYRDWVINAINADMPYDQFVIEQIAGDLLPGATQSQKVATGFLRNSMINEEGGVHPEQFRMEAMFDRMDAIGKSMLGLTIQCAQCHDHKFDPISQKEYFEMFAFINDSSEGSMVAYPPDALAKRAEILDEVRSIEDRLKHETPDWEKRMSEWAEAAVNRNTRWRHLEISNAGDNAQRYYDQEDGSLLAAGYAPTRFTAVFTNTIPAQDVRAFRLEVMTDPNLPSGGPGRALDGMFVLSEFKVEAQSVNNPSEKRWAKWAEATADFSNEETDLESPFSDGRDRLKSGPVTMAIDGDNLTGWGIDAGPGRRNTSRKAVFRAEENIAFDGGTKLTVHLTQLHGGPNSDQNQNLNLGRFRLSWTDDPSATADPVPMDIRAILETTVNERSPIQKAQLFSHWRNTVPEWKAANDRIEALWNEHPDGTTQLVMHRMENPRATHLLKRGDFLKPAGVVAPGVPEVLNPLPDDPEPSRLTFARWMVDRESPTAARSIVNRIWQAYFGTGLVSTSEDLGTQAPEPTHPKLLDWLAVELMEPTFRIGD